MKCPSQNSENSGVLVDYCAQKLSAAAKIEFEQHIATCTECRDQVDAQHYLWASLDLFEAPPVSNDFDQRLQARMAEFKQQPWWSRFNWRPALSFSAAFATLAMVFVLQQDPVKKPLPAVPVHETSKLDSVEPEQVERALDDIEMLTQLSAAGSQNL